MQFLQNLAQRLNKNGVLVISSAWQWQEDKVEKAHWLGGFKRDGENLTSIEGIKELLAENFDLLQHSNIETRMQINPRRAELLDNDLLLFRKK